MKQFLVYFNDNSTYTLNATEIQLEGVVIKILNGTEVVGLFPLDSVQAAVDVSAVVDDDDDDDSDDAASDDDTDTDSDDTSDDADTK